jgi:hypothetical protein
MRSLWGRVMRLSSLPAYQQAQPGLILHRTVRNGLPLEYCITKKAQVGPWKHTMSAKYVIVRSSIWHLAVATLTATIALTILPQLCPRESERKPRIGARVSDKPTMQAILFCLQEGASWPVHGPRRSCSSRRLPFPIVLPLPGTWKVALLH